MLVTIFSDASFHHVTGAAAWHGWAKSARGTIDHGAVLKQECKHSTHAEMAAIVNMIRVSAVSGVAQPADELLIQTDCQAAIWVFQRAQTGKLKPKMVKEHKIFTDAFSENVKAYTAVRFKHVKAHTRNQDARSYVNRLCDKNARKAMRGEMKRRRQEGTHA